MHAAGETELARIWAKVEQIRAKQAAKPKHSPLPEHVAEQPSEGERDAENAASITAPSAGIVPATAAARDVLAERSRQVEGEGWTPEHDDEHADGGLAKAAATYAMYGSGTNADWLLSYWWPWDARWWKPMDQRRSLVKAGALILAEIERIDRAAMSTSKARA
ncbi:hypothetical protein [Cupriavidus basilensis]